MATKTEYAGRIILRGTSTDRTTNYVGANIPPVLYLFEEENTVSPNIYISTGNVTSGYLGPYTAAEVGLGGGGSSDVTGVAHNRVIQVNHDTAPTAAGTGTATWSGLTGVKGLSVYGVRLAVGSAVVPLTATDFTVRYAIGATDDAVAALLLPSVIAHDANSDIGDVGRFNLVPVILTAALDAGRVIFLTLPSPIFIDISEPILRLDFRHAIGTGVNIEFLVTAVEEV
jgi:hypothetical protein